jgi:hypothetical protein
MSGKILATWIASFLVGIAFIAPSALAQTADTGAKPNDVIWQGIHIQRNGWISNGGDNTKWLFYRLPVIRPPGGLPKVWERVEFANLDPETNPNDLSTVFLAEVDCAQGRSRVIQTTAYAGNNQTGAEVVTDTQAAEWTYPPPRSYADAIQRIACSAHPVQQQQDDQAQNQTGAPQVGSSPETEATDRAYEYASIHGACTRIRDRLTDSPADVAACDKHDQDQPECLAYKGFAEVWFNMAHSHDPAMPYQGQMIDGLPTSYGSKNTVIYHIPGFLDQLHRLLAVAKTSKAKSGATFAAYAYRRCMTGNTF